VTLFFSLHNKAFWLSAILLLPFLGELKAVDLYVSPDGSDTNAGTIESPLATMDEAKMRVRTITKGQAITVHLRAGTYPADVANLRLFRAQDSGTAEHPVVYKSFEGETAFFDGIRLVDQNAFAIETNSTKLSRIPAIAHGKVYSQTITDPNLIANLLRSNVYLVQNNRPLSISTTPNQGFLTVDQKLSFGAGDGTFEAPRGPTFTIREEIDFDLLGAELNRGGQQAYTDGYIGTEFAQRIIPLAPMRGTDGEVFTLQNETTGQFSSVNVSRFRVANVLSGLDSPGEWFFDKLDNTLYLWPASGRISSLDRIGPTSGTSVIVGFQANHIRFENFVFQNISDVSPGAAVVFENGDNMVVAGCTFRNIPLPFAPFILDSAATNSSAISCDVIDCARGAILQGGSTSLTSVTPANNTIDNCHFTILHLRHGGGNAVTVRGAGNNFTNNLCHRANTQAIIHAGVDHLFARNEVFNVGMEEGDGGGAYCGASLGSFGNIFSSNFFHHMINTPGLIGRAGMFSDDYDGGETYTANVYYKAAGTAIKLNAGSGHTIVSNVMIDSTNGVELVGRASTYQSRLDTALRLIREDLSDTNFSKENYLGRAELMIGDFVNDQTGEYISEWGNSFWAQRYPILRNMISSSAGRLGMFPSEIRVYDNGFLRCGSNFRRPAGFGGELRSVALSDANFANPSNLDFTFLNKPANMVEIPFASIGLKVDNYRTSAPNKDAYRSRIRARWANTPAFQSGGYQRDVALSRAYFNTAEFIVPESQAGLNVNESDAYANSDLTEPPVFSILTGMDIGPTSPSGSTSPGPEGAYTLQGSGNDIFGGSDAFHYASDISNSDSVEFITKIDSLTNTNPFAKAGVHLSESDIPGSPNVSFFAIPDGRLLMQWRLAQGASTIWNGQFYGGNGFPKWIRIRRIGNVFSGAWSLDGENWTDAASIENPIPLPFSAGLGVTSHSNGTLTTAVFSEYLVNEFDPNDLDQDGLPDSWEIAFFGSTTHSAGGPGEDSDNDGFSDRSEFIAGTDPLDASSLLRATLGNPQPAANQITIEWPSVSGKSYTLTTTTDLTGTWVPLGSATIGDGQMIQRDVSTADDQRFFRIEVSD